MFSERGYQATTVRDIARELNMQAGSLYAHIESKEDVLWQIVDQAAGQFLSAIEPIVEGDASSVEKLRAMVRAHVGVVAGNEGNAAIFLHEWKFLSEARRASVAARRNRYEGFYRRVIEEGIRSGEFAPTDPKMAALMVLSVMNWMPQWYDPLGPLSAQEIAGGFTELMLRGLMPESGVKL
jgi:AcrR family transcriptional regulator